MPFTFAHAAAALPLKRTGLVWSALVIGTMAPDFQYFLFLAPDNGYGHTLRGIFLLSLPLALATLWLFHAFVKRPVVALLPEVVGRRLTESDGKFRFGGVQRFLLIVISILVGIGTHVAWDSFTHRNTWVSREWSFLHERVNLSVFDAMPPLYKIFQHGSSLVGMSVLLVWFLVWCRRAGVAKKRREVSSRHKFLTSAVILSTALLAASVRSFLVSGIPGSQGSLARFLGVWIVTAIALAWWQLVLYGIWQQGSTGQI